MTDQQTPTNKKKTKSRKSFFTKRSKSRDASKSKTREKNNDKIENSYNSIIASLKNVHTRNFSTSSNEPEFHERNNSYDENIDLNGWRQERSAEGKVVSFQSNKYT